MITQTQSLQLLQPQYVLAIIKYDSSSYVSHIIPRPGVTTLLVYSLVHAHIVTQHCGKNTLQLFKYLIHKCSSKKFVVYIYTAQKPNKAHKILSLTHKQTSILTNQTLGLLNHVDPWMRCLTIILSNSF